MFYLHTSFRASLLIKASIFSAVIDIHLHLASTDDHAICGVYIILSLFLTERTGDFSAGGSSL
jgi:hypothetical protein